MAFKQPPNYLTRAESVCLGQTIVVFAEAFLPVLMFGVWTVISPGWKDIVRMATGRSWSHHARRYFEDVEKTKENWITKTGRILGEIAPVLDRALWWCAVIEGVHFTLSNWVSMAWQLHPCPEPGDDLWGTSKLPFDGRPTNYDWQPGPSFVAQDGNITPFIVPDVHIPPGATGTLMIGARFESFIGSEPLAVSMRILDENNNVLDQDDFDGKPYDDRFNGPMVYARRYSGATASRLRCEVRLHEGQSPLVWSAVTGYIGVRVKHVD